MIADVKEPHVSFSPFFNMYSQIWVVIVRLQNKRFRVLPQFNYELFSSVLSAPFTLFCDELCNLYSFGVLTFEGKYGSRVHKAKVHLCVTFGIDKGLNVI